MDDEHRFELAAKIVDGIVRVVTLAIIAAVVVAIASYIKSVLIAYAGKSTEANVAFSFLAKVQADRWLAYIFGGGGVGYGLFQRHLRRKNIKRLTNRPKELEQTMTKHRSSSGLTPEGKTRREDK